MRHRIRRILDRIRLIRERIRLILTGYPRFYWPTSHKYVTQAFGINPQWYNGYGLPGHEGIDLRAPLDSEVRSVWWGEVTLVGEGIAYGNQVRIKHTIRGNEYESIYAHFSEPSHLKVGDRVSRGQVIGKADSTGNSTGSHLHFGLKQYTGEKPDTYWQNKFSWPHNLIDPTPFFKELQGFE